MRLSIMGAALGRGVPAGLGALAAGRLGPGVLLAEEAARRGAHAAGRRAL